MLSGLLCPGPKGASLIDGTELGQIEPRDCRRLIGYLGQDVRLFSGHAARQPEPHHCWSGTIDFAVTPRLDLRVLGPFVRKHHKGLGPRVKDAGAGPVYSDTQIYWWAAPCGCRGSGDLPAGYETTAALDNDWEATLFAIAKTEMAGRTAIHRDARAARSFALTERTAGAPKIGPYGPFDGAKRKKWLAHLGGVRRGHCRMKTLSANHAAGGARMTGADCAGLHSDLALRAHRCWLFFAGGRFFAWVD